MRIAVTGANGYIGRHVVKTLLDFNHDVIALDLVLDKVDDRAEKIITDVLNSEKHFFEKLGRPDAVLHLAWQDGFMHNALSHIENLPLHFNLLKNLVDDGLNQVVVMGSMHEVGYHEGIVNELTPNNPISLYGIAKNALRQSLEVYLRDKPVVFQWLRGFYLMGDDYSNHSVFTKILQMEDEGRDFFPFTDGKIKYDFESIDDLASQIGAIISQKEIMGIINCCSGEPISIKEKVEEFLKDNNLKIKPEYGKFPTRPYDSPIIYGDSTKIKLIMEKKNAK